MVDGSKAGGPSGEDEYMAALQRLDESGWSSGGGFGENEVNGGFYRQEDKLPVGAVEATERLGLLSEQGTLLPGFEIDLDKEAGVVVIGYSGKPDERFNQFVDDLVSWGEELEARQEQALADDEKAAWAKDVAAQLTRQLTQPEVVQHIKSKSSEEERAQEAVTSDVVFLALPPHLQDFELERGISSLEALFAHVIKQQYELRERNDSKEEIKPEFDLLSGIAQGVQLELAMQRDLKALAEERGEELAQNHLTNRIRDSLIKAAPEHGDLIRARDVVVEAYCSAKGINKDDISMEQYVSFGCQTWAISS
jgi:hypothetical protein